MSVDILKKLGNELIDTWIEHCTDENLDEYNREIREIKAKYEKKGVKFIDFDPFWSDILVQYQGHEYFIDLWPGADAQVWDHGEVSEEEEAEAGEAMII